MAPVKQELAKMQYLLMIYQNEAEYGKIDAATGKKMMEEYGAFTQSIVQSGNFKAGDRLQDTHTATTVRVRDGKTLTTDVRSRKHASSSAATIWSRPRISTPRLPFAARIPGARFGSIEVSRSGSYN